MWRFKHYFRKLLSKKNAIPRLLMTLLLLTVITVFVYLSMTAFQNWVLDGMLEYWAFDPHDPENVAFVAQWLRVPVTAEQAQDDIWYFFEALRNTYVAYAYFGGDEVFLPIRDEMIAMLTDVEHEIRPIEFERFIVAQLASVIDDEEFFIGGTSLGRARSFISQVPDLAYDKAEAGFRNRDTGRYLVSMEEYNIEAAMQIHIDNAGDIFYRPVFLESVVVGGAGLTFVYDDGSEVIHRFTPYRYNPPGFSFEMPTLEYLYGIPVVRVRGFGWDGHENSRNREHALAFLDTAEELRDEPVLIVDLRRHIGGCYLMPFRWFYALTGELVPTNFVGLNITVENESELSFYDNNYVNAPEVEAFFRDVESFAQGYNVFFNLPDRIIDNQQIIIILTDRHSGFAPEVFVDLAMNMSNTLIIGNATAGASRFGGFDDPSFLPNSNIAFGFSQTMFIWPENYYTHGFGIRPDIWVGGDPLTAALALLRNAGLGDNGDMNTVGTSSTSGINTALNDSVFITPSNLDDLLQIALERRQGITKPSHDALLELLE